MGSVVVDQSGLDRELVAAIHRTLRKAEEIEIPLEALLGAYVENYAGQLSSGFTARLRVGTIPTMGLMRGW